MIERHKIDDNANTQEPTMWELMQQLRIITRQIDVRVKRTGLAEELKWLTERRKTGSFDPNFREWMTRCGSFLEGMRKIEPDFSLFDYWESLEKSQPDQK